LKLQSKKKPPAEAVVYDFALAGFLKRPQSDSTRRYILITSFLYITVNQNYYKYVKDIK